MENIILMKIYLFLFPQNNLISPTILFIWNLKSKLFGPESIQNRAGHWISCEKIENQKEKKMTQSKYFLIYLMGEA